MGRGSRDAERSAFRIFWEWLTGQAIDDPNLDEAQIRGDPPDFAFSYEGRSIAMEHTHVFRLGENKPDEDKPTAPSQVLKPLHEEAIRNRIRQNLEEILKQTELQPLIVSITFVPFREVITAKKEMAIAREIFDLVARQVEVGSEFPIEFQVADLNHISPCLVNVIAMASEDIPAVCCAAFGQVDEWGLVHCHAMVLG
jgi:hypothetical protein